MIHFMTVYLDRQVHAQALGFTSLVFMYSWGETIEEAEAHVKAYLKGIGVGVRRLCGTAHAVKQSPRSYCFPEQICGLPNELAVEAIRAAGYPADITAETLVVLNQRQQTIADGRRLLEHESEAI